MKAALLAAALLSSACGSLVPDRGMRLDCLAPDGCPAYAVVREALDVFAAEVPVFDPGAPLVVEWHDGVLYVLPDAPADRDEIVGETVSREIVRVTSLRVLAHELMHVTHWREHGSPDPNHAAAPGPWTVADDARVKRVADRLEPR